MDINVVQGLNNCTVQLRENVTKKKAVVLLDVLGCIHDPKSKYSAFIQEEFWIMSHYRAHRVPTYPWYFYHRQVI